jgi:outer membrane lipoprotein SlyB
MKKYALHFLTIISICAFFLAGCAETLSPNTYTAKQAGRVNKVVPATIVSMRPVNISTNTGIGGLAGVVAGAAAGSAIGGGSRMNIIGGTGGALAGGYLGNKVEGAFSNEKGTEYVLRTKDGSYLTVTQVDELNLRIGQKVLIMYGSTTRIVPDTLPPEPVAIPTAPAKTEKMTGKQTQAEVQPETTDENASA